MTATERPEADGQAKARADATRPVRAETFERLRPAALAALVANIGIVLTGGIVRVTGSGLGCAEWPTCDGTSIVPTGEEAAGWHTYVEFGNRLLTFVVLATAIWVVLAARKEAASRPDIRRLAWLQPAGVLGQAVLGGITVLTDLNPIVVALHFLLSMLIIAAATVLLDWVTQGRDPRPPHGLRHLGRALTVVGFAVLVLGTMVTAAGPHAGDPGTPRLAMDIRSLAFAHADAVWLLVGLTIATLVTAKAVGAQRVARAATILLAVELAQGGIGYTQYALGIPAEIVSLHLLGAALVWVAVLRTALALSPHFTRVEPEEFVEGEGTAAGLSTGPTTPPVAAP